MDLLRRRLLQIIAFSLLGIPPAFAKQRRLCVVLDDAGGASTDKMLLEDLVMSRMPFTASVLPYSPYEKQVLDMLGRYKSVDILLHHPLVPRDMAKRNLLPYSPAGIEIQPDDSFDTVYKKLDTSAKHINRLLSGYDRKIIGMNYHRGSLASSNDTVCDALGFYCMLNKLILLDSKTSRYSCVYDNCVYLTNRCLKRNAPFMDHPHDRFYLHDIVKRTINPIITIGHLNRTTVSDYIRFHRSDIEKVRISELIS